MVEQKQFGTPLYLNYCKRTAQDWNLHMGQSDSNPDRSTSAGGGCVTMTHGGRYRPLIHVIMAPATPNFFKCRSLRVTPESSFYSAQCDPFCQDGAQWHAWAT